MPGPLKYLCNEVLQIIWDIDPMKVIPAFQR
jgi:hypothetical protein